jgi:hypothetical protein
MVREVDPKRTRKALRVVRKLAAQGKAAETVDPDTGELKPGDGVVDYSRWETDFLNEIDQRLEHYGSAFRDLGKGRKEDPLSLLQSVKIKEIAAKARGKKRTGLAKRNGLAAKKPRGWKRRAKATRSGE